MTEENKKEPEKISYEIEFEANSNEELLEKIKQTFVKEEDQEEKSIEEVKEEIIEENTVEENIDKIEQEQEKKEMINKIENNEKSNILIISEIEGLVHLPYKNEDIDEHLKTGEFTSREEIVEKVYTVPLSKYTNFTISRLIEGFKLMREREKATLKESMKYAIDLIWERKLHPAIITACKTQDELDIYLACLDENNLQLFDFFEIRFDYRPIKIIQNEF